MARLTIEQIAAPDLSVASQATARAGESFQKGMSSASDLLSQYQEGLNTQGDAELTNLLAGAKNEDEWNAIVASTDFSKMNLSAGMRDNIMNRRDSVLGYEQARSNRRGTDASTGLTIANTGVANANTRNIDNRTRISTNEDDRAGRTSDFEYGGLLENVQLGRAAVRDQQAGLQNGYGNSASGLIAENVSGLDTGQNLGPRRDGSGIPFSPGTDRQIAYRNGIGGIESAGSGDYDAIGANNPTLGRALGRYQIMEANLPAWSKAALGREISVEEFMANPPLQDAIFDNRFGGYVEKYGEENAARAWFGGEGGINNTGASDVFGRLTIGDYGSQFLNNIGSGGGPSPRQPVTQNPNQGGSERQALLAELGNAQFTSAADQQSFLNGSYGYADIGQAAITGADAKAAEEATAQQILDAAAGNVISTDAVVAANNSGKGSTAVEELQRQSRILEQAGEGGALDAARLQIGTTGASTQDIGIADTTLTDIQERQNRDPFQFSQNAASKFVEDPIASLTSAMTGLNISTVPSELESAVNKLATDMGITRAEAAYSFSRAAEDNGGFNANGVFTPGGDNLSQNKAAAFARENFTGDNAATARAALNDDKLVVERIQLATQNLGEVERKIQKLRGSFQIVPTSLIRERDAARTGLVTLYEQYGNTGDNSDNPQAGTQNPS